MTQTPEEVSSQIVDGSRQLAIEIRSQRELAIAKPRKEIDIFKNAIAALEAFPEFAEEAYYSIPYKDKEQGTVLVEGLSVVASREIARLWTNCAVANRIVGSDDEAFEVEGLLADFETNVFFRAIVRVRRTIILRGSSIPVPMRDDRLNTAIQAGLSKAERNATLKAIPAWFKEKYFSTAKKIAASKDKGTKTEAERLEACYAGFKKFGVERDRVEAYVKSDLAGKNVDDIIGTMKGVWNALKDKQAAVEDIFPMPETEKKDGAVKLKDIPGAEL